MIIEFSSLRCCPIYWLFTCEKYANRRAPPFDGDRNSLILYTQFTSSVLYYSIILMVMFHFIFILYISFFSTYYHLDNMTHLYRESDITTGVCCKMSGDKSELTRFFINFIRF